MRDDTAPRVFEAVLYPNQPPGRRAAAAFLGSLTLLAAVVAGIGVAVGAWPVAGFVGVALGLLFAAFARVRRQGRQRELIRLDAAGLHVRRLEPSGASRQWRFEPAGVQVATPPDEDGLTLMERGRKLVLGRFLTPPERHDLARALRAALGRRRR